MPDPSAAEQILAIAASHPSGNCTGIYSLCSANRHVLEAGMQHARQAGGSVLIESTSNQVNQFGGYTGMAPTDFRKYVNELAVASALPPERLILGGDHLGPNAWQHEPAAAAMEKACTLVRDCVRAGYRKIHLDASMPCADDPQDHALPDEVVARRAADMLRVAETTAETVGLAGEQVYVIGTEVPPPGGALEELKTVEPTCVEAANQTLEANRTAFADAGLCAVWPRVVALVVQPGVEFSDDSVVVYDRRKAVPLSRMLTESESMVFEAHSTDYQPPSALKAMVEDHFAILKVGPWLTFAFREALFALAAIENELVPAVPAPSNIRHVLNQAMLANPSNWRKHCHGTEEEQAFARTFGLSDRSRYYWPAAAVQSALAQLLANLSGRSIPLGLLSQYLPRQCEAITEGALPCDPESLIRHHIQTVLGYYHAACAGG